MKKFELSLFSVVLVFLLFSCSQQSDEIFSQLDLDSKTVSFTNFHEIQNDSIRFTSLISKKHYIDSVFNKEIRTYKDQIKLIMLNKGLIDFNEQGLYLRKVVLVDEYYELPQNLEAHVKDEPLVFNSRRNNTNSFDIIEYSESLLRSKSGYEQDAIKREAQYKLKYMQTIFKRENSDLKLLDFYWDYNGETFKTLAVANEERIIYEPLISSIQNSSRRSYASNENFKSPRPQLNKSYDGEPCNSFPQTINEYRVIHVDNYTSLNIGAWAEARVKVPIYEDASCNRYLYADQATFVYDTDYSPGYDAEAKAVKTGSTPPYNGGSVSYKLNVAVSSWSPFGDMAISWDGTKFTFVPGAGGQERGESGTISAYY